MRPDPAAVVAAISRKLPGLGVAANIPTMKCLDPDTESAVRDSKERKGSALAGMPLFVALGAKALQTVHAPRWINEGKQQCLIDLCSTRAGSCRFESLDACFIRCALKVVIKGG